MAQQQFLTEEQWFDLIMAELPAGVYTEDRADDPDPNKNSFSSAELRTLARLLATASENLETIDNDKFATTVTPTGLGRWEKEYFEDPQDASQSFDTRKNNLLAKIRSSGGISFPKIYAVIQSILGPKGLTFDLLPYNGCGNPDKTGAWILDVSSLDYDTYLAAMDPLLGAGRDPGITPLDCDLDYAAAGLTAQDLADIQATAYTYGVYIYGHADAATITLLDRKLTETEPARSTHVIFNDAALPIPPGP